MGNTVDKVAPGLYISGIGGITDKDALMELGVTHVLNCATEVTDCSHYPEFFKYKILGAEDSPNQNLRQHFEVAHKFIEEGMSEGAVVVHCFAGVSRCSTIVTSFLMNTRKLSVTDALGTVQKAHHIARPNKGFMMQLKRYECELNGTAFKVLDDDTDDSDTPDAPEVAPEDCRSCEGQEEPTFFGIEGACMADRGGNVQLSLPTMSSIKKKIGADRRERVKDRVSPIKR